VAGDSVAWRPDRQSGCGSATTVATSSRAASTSSSSVGGYRLGLRRHVERQQAASVTQFELLPRPPEERPENQPWPYWPMKLRTSSSHKEGATPLEHHDKRFTGQDGKVTGLETVNVEFVAATEAAADARGARYEKIWPADLVCWRWASSPETAESSRNLASKSTTAAT